MIEKFLRKYGDGLFLGFMILGAVPLFLYEIEFNVPFYFAFKYLTVPIAALCFSVAYFMLPAWKEKQGKAKSFFITVLAAALFVLMSGGYVIGINAILGSQTAVTISGIVTELHTHTGSRSRTTYSAAVKRHGSGEPVTLGISEKEYRTLEIGSEYAQQWMKGSLGFLYRKKQE